MKARSGAHGFRFTIVEADVHKGLDVKCIAGFEVVDVAFAVVLFRDEPPDEADVAQGDAPAGDVLDFVYGIPSAVVVDAYLSAAQLITLGQVVFDVYPGRADFFTVEVSDLSGKDFIFNRECAGGQRGHVGTQEEGLNRLSVVQGDECESCCGLNAVAQVEQGFWVV